jgi:hypothetical protein
MSILSVGFPLALHLYDLTVFADHQGRIEGGELVKVTLLMLDGEE